MSLTISLLKIEIFNKTNLKARHLEIGTSEISNHFTIPLSRTRQHLIVLKARLLQKFIGIKLFLESLSSMETIISFILLLSITSIL